jgi:DNA-binding MarR family transcriptional regulator
MSNGPPDPRITPGDDRNRGRHAILEELRQELRGYQSALDAFDEAVSHRLGVNRTDLRCLDLLEQRQPMTAGALAEASGLTSGAVTFVIDRLAQAGLVVRRRDTNDRRRVLVELAPLGEERAWALHEPLVKDARRAIGSFSLDEIRATCRFLRTFRQLYEAHGARLRELTDAPAGAGEAT